VANCVHGLILLIADCCCCKFCWVSKPHLESHLELFTGHWLCVRARFAGSHLTVRAWDTLVGHSVGLLYSFIESLLKDAASGVGRSAPARDQHQLLMEAGR
jgi:hypothetical protein